MRSYSNVARHLDKAATLIGVLLPLAAVVVAAIMTWERLMTWRDIAILGGMYCLCAIGITVGSGYLILALERLGLAWNVYRVAPASQEARRAKEAL